MSWPKRNDQVIPGYRDKFCQVPGCGFGPRSALHQHVAYAHGSTADYLKQYGADSLASADLRLNHAAVWLDHIEDGTLKRKSFKNKKLCPHGHRLTAKNTYLAKITRNGKTWYSKRCRECMRESKRKKDKEPSQRCKLKSCNRLFVPKRKGQLFCKPQHAHDYHNKLNWDKVRKNYPRRKCLLCREWFKPRTHTQRYCCLDHQNRRKRKK